MVTASIDIGNTNTSIAVLVDGQVKVIRTSPVHGFPEKLLLPTVIFVDNGNIKLGHDAINARIQNPANFRHKFKREFGTNHTDYINNCQYTTQDYYIEILRYLKNVVESEFSDKIDVLYLTHPPGYNESEQELLKMTATKSGFTDTNIYLVDEPTAAATGYVFNEHIEDDENLLIYDFGGSTLDLALIQKTENGFKPLTVAKSDLRCGGLDFDNALRGLIIEQLQNHPDIPKDILTNVMDIHNINTKSLSFRMNLDDLCVWMKHELSSNETAEKSLQIPDVNFIITILLSRNDFEQIPIVSKKIQDMRRFVEDFITQDGGISLNQVNRVILVGGSCRVPLVKKTLSGIFGEGKLYEDEILELAVCKGALLGSLVNPHMNKIGNGTIESPYIINTPEMLNIIRDKLSSHYILTADIDMKASKNWEPLGSIANPFTGTLDGNGHVISNLSVVIPIFSEGGLFGSIKNAQIKNLSIRNVEINGIGNLGLLSGKIEKSTIENCNLNGKISGDSYIGGIAGKCNDSNICNCSVSCICSGDSYLGGIVGISTDDKIMSCIVDKASYIRSQEKMIGGIAGSISGNSNINDCTSDAVIIGNLNVGGICGITYYPSIIQNTTSNSEILSTSDAGGIIGSANGQLKKSTYYGKINGKESTKQCGNWFNIGSGTEVDPYLISTANGLDIIRDNLSSCFALDRDIDLKEFGQWTPIGQQNAMFTGVLDGCGYSIKNMHIDSDSDNLGLFGVAAPKIIKNIQFIESKIRGKDYLGIVGGDIQGNGIVDKITLKNVAVIGKQYSGSICGRNSATIENIQVDNCDISGLSDVGGITGSHIGNTGICGVSINNSNIDAHGNQIGGIAGIITSGNISNCCVVANIRGEREIGGIAGRLDGGNIIGCTINSTINGIGGIGGIAGIAKSDFLTDSEIVNCKSSGTINGERCKIGGITGTASCVISNCLSRMNIYGGSMVGSITGWFPKSKLQDGLIHDCSSTSTLNFVGAEGGMFDFNKVHC